MKYAEHNGASLTPLIPCELWHLVVGAKLYFGDPRKTPVTVSGCNPHTASFTVTVDDFEDRGAEWNLPLWDISKFLATPSSRKLTQPEQHALSMNIAAMNRRFYIPADDNAHNKSQSDISKLQSEIEDWLHLNCASLPDHPDALLDGNAQNKVWSAALEQVMNSKGLLQIEYDFATQFTSNPNASEMVKGHRIVLAELGLCPYDGHVVRDPQTFEGEWAKPRRRLHILTRLAFMRVLLSKLRLSNLSLYRTVYSLDKLQSPRNNGFVSATFSQDVAIALLEAGKQTRVAAMYWQKVPAERLFMSFLETTALNSRYQEAEAVLLFDQSETAF